MSEDEYSVEIGIMRETDYKFIVDFQIEGVEELTVDEDPPIGRNEGPDPSRLLGAAVAQCMMSSLVFCMNKSHSRMNSLDGTAKIKFGRNEENRLRIIGIDLSINAGIAENEEGKLERCIPIFERFCTVTESIRKGIPVTLSIKTHKSD